MNEEKDNNFLSVGDKILFGLTEDEDDLLAGKILEIHQEPDGAKWIKVQGYEEDDHGEALNGWYNTRLIDFIRFVKR